jgi:hypothetical protein
MLGQRGAHDLGHWHSAKTGFALRRTEPWHSSKGGCELAVHPHMPAQEVDAIDCEPEAFALAPWAFTIGVLSKGAGASPCAPWPEMRHISPGTSS